ncbi:MAG: hypothetical protein RLY30_1016 [Pseudomonadota bacterium]
MTRLVTLLLLLAILVAAVLAFQSYGGAVSIWWSVWRLDMALSTAIFSALLLAFLLYLAYWLLAAIGGLPSWFERQRQRARARNRVAALADLVLDFEEGRFARVTKSAKAFVDEFQDMPEARQTVDRMVATLAARAAHALRDPALRAQWMLRLEAKTDEQPAHPQIQTLLAAEFALDERRGEEGLKALEPLVAGDRKHVHAMRLLLRAYQQTARWVDVLRVLRLLENRKALVSGHAQAIRERALDSLLLEAGSDPSLVQSAVALLSADEQSQPSTARRIAWAWLRAGEPGRARRLIESVLTQHWDDALLEPYADCEDDAASQLAQLDRWVSQQPGRQGSFEMAWARGRLLERRGHLDESVIALERALQVRPSVRVALLLADLSERAGSPERARHFRAVASEAAATGRLLPST